ncbi:hypothetical protein O3M35_011403 [Rhynocoris fuscipes]|uniref:Uncharacterized protein n=1 Tax=Rhynocoris fuscipes TaxID=488301 RepID=A0AAW1CVM5_9HEMI
MRWNLSLDKYILFNVKTYFKNSNKLCLNYQIKWTISVYKLFTKKIHHPNLGWEKNVILCGNERTPSHSRVLHRTL